MFKSLTRSLALVAVFALTNATVSAAEGWLNLRCYGVDKVAVTVLFSNKTTQDFGQVSGELKFNLPDGVRVVAFILTARSWNPYYEEWENSRLGAVTTTVAATNNPRWTIESCLTMKVIPAN